jgi:hypothetical protein
MVVSAAPGTGGAAGQASKAAGPRAPQQHDSLRARHLKRYLERSIQMKSLKYLIAAGAMSFALPAFAQDLVVTDAYLTPLAGVENAAGLYMVILNNGKALDTLLGATCEIAGGSELLATISDAKGAPQLVPQPQGKEIMNSGGFTLAPGGYQVALLNLKSPLKSGEKVMVTLKFATAGDVPVEAVVK